MALTKTETNNKHVTSLSDPWRGTPTPKEDWVQGKCRSIMAEMPRTPVVVRTNTRIA